MTSVPDQIGPYRIVREIGRGGMGVVHLGRDTKLDRDVAVKALPEDLAAGIAVEEFRDLVAYLESLK